MSKKQIPFPTFHPLVDEVSKSLYESSHYTDALRKASIKLEEECAKKLFQINGQELTGEPLMMELFIPKNGKANIEFVNLSKKGAESKQKSFAFMYSGFAGVIRNTLSHNSDDLKDVEALYGLNMVSYLFYKLDQVQHKSNILEGKSVEKPIYDLSIYNFETQEDELVDIYLKSLRFNKDKPKILLSTDNLTAINIAKKSIGSFVVDIVDKRMELYNLYMDNSHYKNMVINKIISNIKKN